jgi:hypothetical protein
MNHERGYLKIRNDSGGIEIVPIEASEEIPEIIESKLQPFEPEYKEEDLVELQEKFPIMEIKPKNAGTRLMIYIEKNTVFSSRSVFIDQEQPIEVIKFQINDKSPGTFNRFAIEEKSGEKYQACVLMSREVNLELRGKEHPIKRGTVFGLISPETTLEERIINF